MHGIWGTWDEAVLNKLVILAGPENKYSYCRWQCDTQSIVCNPPYDLGHVTAPRQKTTVLWTCGVGGFKQISEMFGLNHILKQKQLNCGITIGPKIMLLSLQWSRHMLWYVSYLKLSKGLELYSLLCVDAYTQRRNSTCGHLSWNF